jgi:hypothetical protein
MGLTSLGLVMHQWRCQAEALSRQLNEVQNRPLNDSSKTELVKEKKTHHELQQPYTILQSNAATTSTQLNQIKTEEMVLLKRLSNLEKENARTAFENVQLRTRSAEEKWPTHNTTTAETEELKQPQKQPSVCTIAIMDIFPEKLEKNTVYITSKNWALLTQTSPYFKALQDMSKEGLKIEGYSREIVEFTIKYILNPENEECKVWKKQIKDPLVQAFLRGHDLKMLDALALPVQSQLTTTVEHYIQQIITHLEFAIEIQDDDLGFHPYHFHTGSITFWEERLCDLCPDMSDELLAQIIGLCNRYSLETAVISLRPLEDLCLRSLVARKTPAPALQLSLLRIGHLLFIIGFEFRNELKEIVNAQHLLPLFRQNRLSLAKDALIECTWMRPEDSWSSDDRVLVQELLKLKRPLATFSARTQHSKELIELFAKEGFPRMFVLEGNSLNMASITFHLPHNEEWCCLHLENSKHWPYVGRRCFFRKSNESSCRQLLTKYYGPFREVQEQPTSLKVI